MDQIIVLAMHGQSPSDFPKAEKMEFFRLHSELNHLTGEKRIEAKKRHDEIELKMRKWPRTKENDLYYFASYELADAISQASGNKVIVGFNEFCAPDIDQAIDEAAKLLPERVCVITPMMTRGGGHSEHEIPAIVEKAQKRYPQFPIMYVWPFDSLEIGKFLASQVERFLEQSTL